MERCLQIVEKFFFLPITLPAKLLIKCENKIITFSDRQGLKIIYFICALSQEAIITWHPGSRWCNTGEWVKECPRRKSLERRRGGLSGNQWDCSRTEGSGRRIKKRKKEKKRNPERQLLTPTQNKIVQQIWCNHGI